MTGPNDPGTGTTWRIDVDRDRCMATGACVYAAPEVFTIDDDAVAKVIGPVDGTDKLLRDVVAECPADALRLVATED